MPKDAVPAEVDAFLKDNPDVKTVELLMPDMCGILRGKRLTRNSFSKLYSGAVRAPGSLYLLDTTGHGVPSIHYGNADGDPDNYCHPVPGTLAPVPWAERPTGQVLGFMTLDDGAPLFSDPRAILAGAVAMLGRMGFKPHVAVELEFYLLDKKAGRDGKPQAAFSEESGYRQSTIQVAGMEELYDFEAFLAEVERTCAAQGLPAEAAFKEYAPSQYEINLHYVADALTACDHAVMLKRAIRAVARRHGMVASFMAKPFQDLAGSGMHAHVSLYDKAGGNVFATGKRTEINGMAVGEKLLHAVGGLIETMAESMAIFAPNANSYRRFQPGLFVPVSPSWGVNNRAAGIRIPPSDDQAMRIEHRNAGADANPYLAVAAILAGIHHGLAEKIGPPPPSDGNTDPDGLPDLPLNWFTALDRFRDGAVLRAAMGEKYHGLYEACRRFECEAFMARIQPLDYEWYMRVV